MTKLSLRVTCSLFMVGAILCLAIAGFCADRAFFDQGFVVPGIMFMLGALIITVGTVCFAHENA